MALSPKTKKLALYGALAAAGYYAWTKIGAAAGAPVVGPGGIKPKQVTIYKEGVLSASTPSGMSSSAGTGNTSVVAPQTVLSGTVFSGNVLSSWKGMGSLG